MTDLLVIVPSRGRPESAARVIEAWTATGAWRDAELLFAVDADDPTVDDYRRVGSAASASPEVPGTVWFHETTTWQPMVRKLDDAARASFDMNYFALAFMGDDHVPRTPGWTGRYLAELRRLRTGIVYGNDLIQGARLPTQWAMTSDIVRALGRMVPADVEHLYCDNAIADLGQTAGCLSYLDDVVIEHRHPVAGRADWDAQYRRVNSPEQYTKDGAAYRRWRAEQMPADVAAVRALRQGVSVDA